MTMTFFLGKANHNSVNFTQHNLIQLILLTLLIQ
jgi:hypothetical protein